MNSHTFSYKLTEDDLIAFNKFHIQRAKRKILLDCLLGALAGGIVIALLLYNTSHDLFASVLTCVIITLLIAPFIWKLRMSQIRAAIKKQVEANESSFLREERTVQLSEEGIREQTSLNDSLHRWSGIHEVGVTSHHVFIHTAPSVAIIVPKTALAPML